MPPLGRENFSASVRVRVEKISRSPRAGIAARGCAQVTADENRKARRTNKSTLFVRTERSGVPFGDTGRWRPPGRRQQTAGEGLAVAPPTRWAGLVIVRELRLVSGLSVAVALRRACVSHLVRAVSDSTFPVGVSVSKVVFSPLRRVLIRVPD